MTSLEVMSQTSLHKCEIKTYSSSTNKMQKYYSSFKRSSLLYKILTEFIYIYSDVLHLQ